MGMLSWMVLGLIAGALAKWLMPGRDGGGWIVTMVLGIVGGLVGGYLGTKLGLGATTDGLNLGSIATATVGAFLVLFVYKQLK